MSDDGRLEYLLRSSLSPAADGKPSRDLWPLVARRMHARVAPSWLDISMAAVVFMLLIMFPDWLLFLVYHL